MELSNNDEQEFINAKINALKLAGDWIPGIKIVQNTRPHQNLYLCDSGQKHFGLTEAFFTHLPDSEYKSLIFDPEDIHTCLLGGKEYDETSSSTKKFYIRHQQLQERHEVELIIVHHLLPHKSSRSRFTFTQIIPLSFQSWAVPKTKRIAQEMSFRKVNDIKFSQLTDRNKEVLSLMVRCLKAEEIGDKLFIGVNTVNSHKKRIKEILETNESWDILQYGLAYDMLDNF
ncbi:helix-turn-helix transcriptional regulator [Lunatibacter salilacus]|uniref:helix-turn-helix transcriptional regulator n=1 Tax=Lunatibacter salilacus TaxID=2483804 RepID=UPI00131CC488|nr:helix-turn-helix transcriptional regulator [Lunatibacter salilacus]